jgi:hypothetical protein
MTRCAIVISARGENVVDGGFAEAREVDRFSENAHNALLSEARIADRGSRPVSRSASAISLLVMFEVLRVDDREEKDCWVGQIEIMTNLSDQIAIPMSLAGDPPVTFHPATSLEISVLQWIIPIGSVCFIVTESQRLRTMRLDLSFQKHFLSL